MRRNFPKAPLPDPQNEPPASVCQNCRGEIYSDEVIYLWEGREVCPDCFRGAVERLLETSPVLLAQELGVETRRCAPPPCHRRRIAAPRPPCTTSKGGAL